MYRPYVGGDQTTSRNHLSTILDVEVVHFRKGRPLLRCLAFVALAGAAIAGVLTQLPMH